MSLVKENALQYISMYESKFINEYFEEFSRFVGSPVTELQSALSEIMLDFARYSQLHTSPEFVNLGALDTPSNRILANVESIERVVKIRTEVSRLISNGKLSEAQFGIESSASIIATMAYDLYLSHSKGDLSAVQA